VFGLLFSIGLIGGMTFPWAVGQVSQQLGVRSGMVVPAVGAIAIIGFALRLAFFDRTSNALAAGN
jgi:hypothetical protein